MRVTRIDIAAVAVLMVAVASVGIYSAATATGPEPVRLSQVERVTIVQVAERFEQSTAGDASLRASMVAWTITAIALRHVGTSLSGKLAAASDAWIALARAIDSGRGVRWALAAANAADTACLL